MADFLNQVEIRDELWRLSKSVFTSRRKMAEYFQLNHVTVSRYFKEGKDSINIKPELAATILVSVLNKKRFDLPKEEVTAQQQAYIRLLNDIIVEFGEGWSPNPVETWEELEALASQYWKERERDEPDMWPQRRYLRLVAEAFADIDRFFVMPHVDEIQYPETSQTSADVPRTIKIAHEIPPIRVPMTQDYLSWLKVNEGALVLAEAGGGKTYFLRYLTKFFCQARRDFRTEKLPIYIPLSDFYLRERNILWYIGSGVREGLMDALIRWKFRALSVSEARYQAVEMIENTLDEIPFNDLLEQGKLILLLDGFNEIPLNNWDPPRSDVIRFILHVLARGNKVFLSHRTSDGYLSIPGLTPLELKPFDNEQLLQAIQRYTDEDVGRRLWEQLNHRSNQGYWHLLSRPLNVSLLRQSLESISDLERSFPQNRGVLLAKVILRLLKRESIKKQGSLQPHITEEVTLSGLAAIASLLRAEKRIRGTPTTRADIVSQLEDIPLLTQPGTIDQLIEFGVSSDLLKETRSRVGKSISFQLETIADFFAGCFLLDLYAKGKLTDLQHLWDISRLKSKSNVQQRRLGDMSEFPTTGWEEPTIIASGLLDWVEDAELLHSKLGDYLSPMKGDRFLSTMMATNPHLAGRCIVEGGPEVSAATIHTTKERLHSQMIDNKQPDEVRAPSGLLLGRMGDHRFHHSASYQLPADATLGFVPVQSGPFAFGSNSQTVARLKNELRAEADIYIYDFELGHENPFTIAYPYWIGRYPVTNEQFHSFVNAGGYQRKEMLRFWTGRGVTWLRGDRKILQPAPWWGQFHKHLSMYYEYRAYGDYETYRRTLVDKYLPSVQKDSLDSGYWTNPLYTAPNLPVMGVNYYEATAYANWLDEKLRNDRDTPKQVKRMLENGYRVRLPTEAEWEKAARGGLEIHDAEGHSLDNPFPRREWPWGTEWDADKCNTIESGEHTPYGWITPTGMHKSGQSPYGIMDMCGQLWEWAAGELYAYPDAPEYVQAFVKQERHKYRVLRGGSWHDDRSVIRCATRMPTIPHDQHWNLGIRLVIGPAL